MAEKFSAAYCVLVGCVREEQKKTHLTQLEARRARMFVVYFWLRLGRQLSGAATGVVLRGEGMFCELYVYINI
jgi:hypothetical protein